MDYDIVDQSSGEVVGTLSINDGGGGELPPINWPKVFMFLLTIVGAANTFAIPLLMFFNKDSFVEGGWIFAALPSLILGVPILVTGIALLVALAKSKDVDNADDEVMVQARDYVSANIIRETSTNDTEKEGDVDAPVVVYAGDDDTSDEYLTHEEYVDKMLAEYRQEAAVAAVYLALKFNKLISRLALLSYLVYPIGILCFVAEALYGNTESYLIVVGILNYFVLLLGALSVWKNYKRYKSRGRQKIAKRMLLVTVVSFLLGTAVSVVLISALNMSGYCILCVSAMLFDLAAMIDSATVGSGVGQKKAKIHLCPSLW